MYTLHYSDILSSYNPSLLGSQGFLASLTSLEQRCQGPKVKRLRLRALHKGPIVEAWQCCELDPNRLTSSPEPLTTEPPLLCTSWFVKATEMTWGNGQSCYYCACVQLMTSLTTFRNPKLAFCDWHDNISLSLLLQIVQTFYCRLAELKICPWEMTLVLLPSAARVSPKFFLKSSLNH